ncbi:hypothetical protein [Nocardioides sp. Kera G14]|uniref:hypothetical protein n=1 Tax=Nocardioides sp. Kera G14 TaxID=2884264 RepID=UPI001D102C03|nr:hypothetical protein [Nocardioides sp. Kera G14]UDY24095.1 hypothetical protein LH076_02010 [Nocardioides sp. Kera G14]
MEILTVALSDFSRRSRSVVARHSETMLTRGLERGEQVILSDDDFHWVATVADVDFEIADTLYRLELGVRLEADEVADRVRQPTGGPLQRHDLLDLLGHLRASRQFLETRLARAQL